MVAPNLKYPKTLGGLVHQLELSKALAKKGHEVHLITQSVGPYQKDSDLSKISIHEIRLIPLPFIIDRVALLLKTIILILKLGRKYNFDLIHDRGYIAGGAGTIAGVLLRKPVLLQVDDNWFESASYHYRYLPLLSRFLFLTLGKKLAKYWLNYVVLPNVKHIVVVSRFLKNAICRDWGCSISQVSVIPNAVNLARFNPPANNNGLKGELGLENKNTVMFIGEIAPWQGVEYLLGAVAKIVKEFPSVMAVVVGGVSGAHSNYFKQLINMTSNLRISKHVTFIGVVPHSEIPNIIAAADIAVAPFISSKRGRLAFSPLKIFEYMAMEKPIIASKVPWIEEILEDNETAMLVKPNSGEAIAEAMMKLFSNPDIARCLGENARRIAEEKYGWDKVATNIEEIYRYMKKN